MMQPKSAFCWSGLITVAGLLFAIREALLSAAGIPQCASFALVRGMLEIPIPQRGTELGYVLAGIGAVAITGMTYFVGKCILDKKDITLIIVGFAFGFGIMANGAVESSAIFWLPVAAATGVVTAYLSDKLTSFRVSEALSVGTAIILGVTTYMAVGHGLFVAAIVELLLLVCYWLGVFAIVIKSLRGEDAEDNYEEEYYRVHGQE